MSGHPAAARFALAGLAGIIQPPEPMPLSRWLERNLVLVDGPAAGQFWSAAGAPYLVEVADCLSDDHPCNTVTIRKSQQSGASILGLGWCLYIADREPANTLYAAPSLDFLRDISSQKLGPLIEAWQRHTGRTVIQPQTSRSGVGSTSSEKKFPGGYIALANANAVTDLSSKTVKKGVKDELSKWADIPGFGDPETLFFGRFTAFRRTKDYKILEISTPEVDSGDETGQTPGHCRIDRSFLASDRRFWHVPCPECGTFFVHDPERLAVDYDHPHRTTYTCEACSHAISESERVGAVRAGHWRPTVDPAGREPGFHIDAFISLMMSYEAIAEDRIKAERIGSEKARKDLSNLIYGRPYKFRGDAPDHKRLMERREAGLRQGHVPAGGLLLVASADVQMRGIWFEVVAIAPDRQSWLVERGYIEGDTADPNGQVYRDLFAQTLDRRFPDAFGGRRRIDALGIDTGYQSHVVYSVVRAHQRVHPETGRDLLLAVDGRDGWGLPAIGTPKLVDIDLDGRRVKQGCKLWPIGTWSLKSSLYADLHKPGIRSGAAVDPPGYCHFGDWVDEGYFRQITAERLDDIVVRGQVTGRKWVPSTENHLLDCRVYNMALAEYLGLSSMAPDEWAALAQARGLPDELTRIDLFTPQRREPAPAADADQPEAEAPAPEPAPATPEPPRSDWIGRDTSEWF